MELKPILLDIDPIVDVPIALALVKEHCAITGTNQDATLAAYLRGAFRWAEGFTHRSLIARRHRWVISGFPACREIRLPRGKTQSVEGIAYSLNGEISVLYGPSNSPAGTDYQESLLGDDGGLLMPNRTSSWPAADLDVPAPVTISLTAGYSDSQLPEDVIPAILFAVDDSLELKGSADVPAQMLSAPRLQIRESMLTQFCLHRWY